MTRRAERRRRRQGGRGGAQASRRSQLCESKSANHFAKKVKKVQDMDGTAGLVKRRIISRHAAHRHRRGGGGGGGDLSSKSATTSSRSPIRTIPRIPPAPPRFEQARSPARPLSIRTIPPVEQEHSFGFWAIICDAFTCEIYFLNQYFQYFFLFPRTAHLFPIPFTVSGYLPFSFVFSPLAGRKPFPPLLSGGDNREPSLWRQ